MNLKYVFLAMVAVCSGCSSSQQANETNFKDSVQAYLDKEYPKCYLTENFPIISEKILSGNEKKLLRLMAKNGLLSEKETSRKEIGGAFGMVKELVVNYSYDLTEEGKRFYKPEVETRIDGNKIGGFCFGTAKVSSIDQFTDPTDIMGKKISKVIYSYSVSGFPEWAKNEEIMSTINSGLKEDIDSENAPKKKNIDLMLTNNGWMPERLFK
jgi:hypothetical protein